MANQPEHGRRDGNDALQILGNRIKELRLERHLKQGQLAARARLHPNAIYLIETGQRNVSAKNLLKIAIALKVHPSALWDGFSSTDLRRLARIYDEAES